MMYVAVGTEIQRWNAGAVKTSLWHSKRFNLPRPTAFSCYQVKANSFANLTLKLTATLDTAAQATAVANASCGHWVANGSQVTHTSAVTSGAIHRLPSGFKAYLWEVEMSGTDHWTFAAVASSVGELKGV